MDFPTRTHMKKAFYFIIQEKQVGFFCARIVFSILLS